MIPFFLISAISMFCRVAFERTEHTFVEPKKCVFESYDSGYFSPVMWVGPAGSEVSALNLLTKSATVIAM